MNIYYRLEDIPKELKNTVVTIGSFDGVHQGHQRILSTVCEKSNASQPHKPSVVVTFHPHPRLVLGGANAKVELLTTLEEKAHWLATYGIENMIVVPFTKEFANQEAETYIADFLVEQVGAEHIIIGYDHKFGKGRQGDLKYLQERATKYNYTVEEIPSQDIDDIIVSSTKIREALKNGLTEKARKLLGHPFRLSGKVVHGLRIGRTIGFPTANIDISAEPNKLIPKIGIYSVLVHIKDKSYEGMLYIGNRPTIDKDLNMTIEVNIFDLEADIYDEYIALDLIDFLREDEKFTTLENLSAKLAEDKIHALASLKKYKSNLLV